jgi:hypothetical protein
VTRNRDARGRRVKLQKKVYFIIFNFRPLISRDSPWADSARHWQADESLAAGSESESDCG